MGCSIAALLASSNAGPLRLSLPVSGVAAICPRALGRLASRNATHVRNNISRSFLAKSKHTIGFSVPNNGGLHGFCNPRVSGSFGMHSLDRKPALFYQLIFRSFPAHRVCSSPTTHIWDAKTTYTPIFWDGENDGKPGFS